MPVFGRVNIRQLTGWLLLFALLLHIPFAFNTAFFADDYIQHFALHGNPQLQEKGFANRGEPGTLAYAIKNQFYFFHPQAENYQTLRQSGAIPWWVHDDAYIHFFRPLTSVSHWLDYQLWPDNIRMMHAHSLLIVLLAWLAMFFLYRRFLAGRTVLMLAMLIVVLNISLIPPLHWLSARNSLLLMLWLPLVLLCLNSARQHWPLLPLAWLLYGMALLTAEGGVAIGGFIVAWLLFLHKGSWRNKAWLFLPFAVITLLWRWYYQSQGYGAYAVGQYIDPAAAPLTYLVHLFWQYPVLVLHTVTGLEATDFYIQGRLRLAHALAGYLLMLLPIWLAVKLKVANRSWWFFYSAALLSLLPMTSLTLSDPRVSLLAYIGFAPALAMILLAFCRQAKEKRLRWPGTLAVVLLGISHLLLAFIAKVLIAITPMPDADGQDARFNAFGDFEIENRHLLIVNAVDPFRLMYHAYRNAWHDQPVAASIRPLMLAHEQTRIQRLDKNRYRLEQSQGMMLHPDDVARWFQEHKQHGWQNPGSVGGVEGMSYLLLGFFHDGHYDFTRGQRLEFDEASITIKALKDGRPSVLLLEIHKPDALFVYWDWQTRQYHAMEELAAGESKTIRGKYDNL